MYILFQYKPHNIVYLLFYSFSSLPSTQQVLNICSLFIYLIYLFIFPQKTTEVRVNVQPNANVKRVMASFIPNIQPQLDIYKTHPHIYIYTYIASSYNNLPIQELILAVMGEVKNKFVVIKDHVNGAPTESDFEIRTETVSLSSAAAGAVIVKNLYVSVDPYQLNRMKTQSSSQGASSFAAPILPAQVYSIFYFIFEMIFFF